MPSEAKLRSLLAEARAEIHGRLGHSYDCEGLCSTHQLIANIDAALAEPVSDALEWQTAITKALSESQERLAAEVREAIRERDEARAALEKVTRERDWYLSELRECKP